MYKATQSAARVLSPLIQRRASISPSASQATCSRQMSSGTKDKKHPQHSSPSSKSGVGASAPEPVLEKGDTYKSGEAFFSHNAYSFYDIENKMESNRCPQPSSEKMKELCLDKLNPEDKQDPRKLLAVDYGDLEEYPNKPGPIVNEKPARPVVRGKYGLGSKLLDKDSLYKARMPL